MFNSSFSTKLQSESDNNLVKLAQSGNEEAYSALVGRYIFLVRNCANNYFSDTLDFDDLMQEGLIGLMNAVNAFELNCNTSFFTFARLCIDRNIISAVRKSFRKKQIPQSMLTCLDDNPSLIANDVYFGNPESAMIAREDFEKLKKSIFAKLSSKEMEVLNLYLQGLTYEKIAEKLKISAKSVDNALQRLRAKLR